MTTETTQMPDILNRLMAHESDAKIVQLHEYCWDTKGPKTQEYKDGDWSGIELFSRLVGKRILIALADMNEYYRSLDAVPSLDDIERDASPVEVYWQQYQEFSYHCFISVWVKPVDTKYIYVKESRWGVDQGMLIKGTENHYWRIEVAHLREIVGKLTQAYVYNGCVIDYDDMAGCGWIVHPPGTYGESGGFVGYPSIYVAMMAIDRLFPLPAKTPAECTGNFLDELRGTTAVPHE